MTRVALCVLILAGLSIADTTWVVIGEQYQLSNVPFYDWGAMRCQFLYKSSELGQRGRISALAMDHSYGGGDSGAFFNVRVKLCHTSKDTLDSTFASNFTVLSSSSLDVGTGAPGWWYFPLDTEFFYDNQYNLLLEVTWRDCGGTGVWVYGDYHWNRTCYAFSDTALQGDGYYLNRVRIGITPTYQGRLLSPNGGEYWAGGDTESISWTVYPKSFFYTKLLLSTDGGSSFPYVIAPSRPPTDTVYSWVAPQYNSGACRVKVQVFDSTNTVVMEDASDANFTIDSESPAAPSLVYPPANGAINNPSVVFRWHRASDNLSGIAYYTVQVAYDSAFTALADTARRADTTYARSLPADTTYFWRVRATDRCGNVGPWSSVWKFEIDAQTPGVPTLLEPVGGVWLRTSTVVFRWTPVVFEPRGYSPVRYIVQLDTIAGVRPLYTDTTIAPCDTFSFLPEARYWWRVRAYDLANNQGSFSGTQTFGIDMSPPQVPNLIYPPHLGQIRLDTTSLVWHASRDNLSGTDTYWLQLASDSLFADTIPVPTPTTPDTLEVVTLPSQAQYFWRVKANDHAGNWCAWSLPWSFSYSVGIAEFPRGGGSEPRVLYCGPTPAVRWASVVLSTPRGATGRVQVFGMTGLLVRTLHSGFIPAGEMHLKWNGLNDAGRRAGAGVYCVLVSIGGQRFERRLVMAE
jgi:hypothetical protein